jgi:hypothetical protein
MTGRDKKAAAAAKKLNNSQLQLQPGEIMTQKQPCMRPLCGTVLGLLALLAGAVLLFSGLAMLDVRTSLVVAGAALSIYGIGALLHAANLCPACK